LKARAIDLHWSMGDRIIAHLRALGQLPASGYLAGQAVSSAIFDLFGEGAGAGLTVYNDLDVFYNATSEDRQWVTDARCTLDTVSFKACRVELEYGHLRFAQSTAYNVVRSYREQLVNLVAKAGSPASSPMLGGTVGILAVQLIKSGVRLQWMP
jgi:hypothetical protein